jgi:CubicO group peptidase (beta-lactamase class C family)
MPADATISQTLIMRRGVLRAGLAACMLPSLVRGGELAAPSADLESFIRSEMRKAQIPGLAVGLACDGVVQFASGYGLADIDKGRAVTSTTMFHIASITKTVTATMIGRLAERGKLGLDDPVARYLDFPVAHPRFSDTAITFRQLLMHTSSISDARYYDIDFRVHGRDAEQDLADFLRQYLVPTGANYSEAKCYSSARPGATWDYSNVGFALLGYLAGRIGAADMREQTHKDIFGPLGMRHTSWTIMGTPASDVATPSDTVDGALKPVEAVGFPDWPVGMLRSSIGDFMKFVAASANGGRAGTVQVLGAAMMTQMLESRSPAGLPAWLSGQGLGWMVSPLAGVSRPNHWGGDPGVFTAVYLDPATRSGVAVFTNASASAASRVAVKNIADRLLRTGLR